MELEAHLKDHDQQIQAIFEAIHQLMAAPEKPKKIYPVISESYLTGEIGYTVKEKQKVYGKK